MGVECLEKGGEAVRGCGLKKEGRALNAGCYFRYSTKKFYNDHSDTEHEHGFKDSRGVIVAIVMVAIAFTMLSLFAAYAGYTKLLQIRKECSNIGLGSISITKNLISGVQHKHLVNLLGCSIEGSESFLVYEYVPNRSLDQFIFYKKNDQFLNWKQRFDVIVGTAEGIAYLHEGSDVRIIHREIKSSNILPDENLSPKITDFGLARCFASDKSHLSTGIAGTLAFWV